MKNYELQFFNTCFVNYFFWYLGQLVRSLINIIILKLMTIYAFNSHHINNYKTWIWTEANFNSKLLLLNYLLDNYCKIVLLRSIKS